MYKNIFITGTGTDIGKTYITALLIKKMSSLGLDVAYYKAVVSGAKSIESSDAGYVKNISHINQKTETLLSYIYEHESSPHLASKIANTPIELNKILSDYKAVADNYDYVVMEGSGGIICPLRYDDKKIFLEDIILELKLPVIVVAGSGLGTINSTLLTIEYIKQKGIDILGIIFNRYNDTIIERDNIYMIEDISGVKVISVVKDNAEDIDIDDEIFNNLFVR